MFDTDVVVDDYINNDDEVIINPSLATDNTPESPRQQMLHEIHADWLSDSMLSTEVNGFVGYEIMSERLKDKRSKRNDRIRQKESASSGSK